MKLASLAEGRDGRLVVVTDDLTRCIDARHVAPTLQHALDAWDEIAPRLRAVRGPWTEPFDPARCASPLPRAYQWADGSAYVNHVELVRKARKAEMPKSFWSDPLMYQGGSDGFLAPLAPIPLADEAWGCDFEAEIVVVVGDVRQGSTREQCLEAIRLVGLVNDVSLRALIPAELDKGFGFFQSKPASAFAPVFVTPDALGDAFRAGKLHRRVEVRLNDKPFGRANAGIDMTFDFGVLIAHAARTRDLGAGTIIGSGTVSNRGPDGGPGRSIDEGGDGYSCIAEVRMVETILKGAPLTPFLRWGDRVQIDVLDDAGRSIFGAIDQVVQKPG
jgi:fumarylacetoacetate (FAA) hydrolase